MFHKYKISVDGNNLLAYSEDITIFTNFLVKLFSYYEGKKIEIKKVRYYDDAELHEFLHRYDLEGEDYALLTENLQVFAQPYFEYFLDGFALRDADNAFADYISYSETSQFICAGQDIELSKEAD
jgi:hypothetical protein